MRYKLFFLFLITFFSIRSFAQEKPKVQWIDFEEAIAKAQKIPKKIFIDLYTTWCGWCIRMDKDTFSDSTIAAYMNENFYCVKFNAERNDSIQFMGHTFINPVDDKSKTHQLAIALLSGKMSYPSYAFMNEEQKMITVIPGYHKPKEFEVMLNFIGSDAFVDTKFPEYQKTFKSSFDSIP